MAEIMPIGPGGGMVPFQIVEWSRSESVAPGESIEYVIMPRATNYITAGLIHFAIRLDISAPTGGIDESAVGIKVFIPHREEYVPDDYWEIEHEPGSGMYLFDCLNPGGFGFMVSPLESPRCTLSFPTSPDIRTDIDVTATATVMGQGSTTTSAFTIATGEMTTRVEAPAPSDTVLTATDPVSWAEAGTLRALVANPLRWKMPVGLTLSTEGWVDIAPPPPEPLVPDERHVRWAIYEDGTLVINGENEPNYNGHGAVAVSCDTSEWYGSGYSYIGLLDLDAEDAPPWQEHSTNSGRLYPSSIERVTRVEFAAPTEPAHMNRWFLDAKNIVTIDDANLGLGRCESMNHLFAQIPIGEGAVVGDVNSIPYLGDWDVSNVQSMMYAFATPLAQNGVGRWPRGTVLSLGMWSPPMSCDVTRMFMGNSGLELIFANFYWDPSWDGYEGDDMFYGCTSLHNLSTGVAFDPERVDASMANTYDGGYFMDGALDPGDPTMYPDPISRLNSTMGFSSELADQLGNPVEYPLANLVRAIDGYVAVTGEFTRALRSSITDLSQIEPFLYVDADAVAEAWRAIEGDPECARAELEGLLSSIGGDFSDAGLTFEVTGVERTEYLTYVDFTLNGTPVRTSLRLPALL